MRFADMREWMAAIDRQNGLRRSAAPVDWDREIGAIARRVLQKKGPALLFENIRGYERGQCTRLFTGGLKSVGNINGLGRPATSGEATGPTWGSGQPDIRPILRRAPDLQIPPHAPPCAPPLAAGAVGTAHMTGPGARRPRHRG